MGHIQDIFPMNELYTIFHNIPLNGIAALINEQDKRIFIFHSTKLIETIASHIRRIKMRIHDIPNLNQDSDKLTLLVLDSINNKYTRLGKYAYWIDLYKQQGYTLYLQPKRLTRYSPRIMMRKNKVCVELVSSSRRYLTAAKFTLYEEAEKYIETHYGSGIILPEDH